MWVMISTMNLQKMHHQCVQPKFKLEHTSFVNELLEGFQACNSAYSYFSFLK